MSRAEEELVLPPTPEPRSRLSPSVAWALLELLEFGLCLRLSTDVRLSPRLPETSLGRALELEVPLFELLLILLCRLRDVLLLACKLPLPWGILLATPAPLITTPEEDGSAKLP